MREVVIPFVGQEPTRAHSDDAAFDLYAAEDVVLHLGAVKIVPCGLKTAIPEGYVGLFCSRSGLAAKSGVFVLNAPGVIDAGYRGEWCAILLNLGDAVVNVQAGDRVGQALFVKLPDVRLEAVDELPGSLRGEGGLGSTGA